MRETTDTYGTDTYEILEQIGRGSYASVHKAINKRTGEICAIKKMISSTTDMANLITEIGIISKSKCKNIVRYLASHASNKEVLIVMEYCCGGSVKDAMRQLGRTMNVEHITIILKDVLNGLDYLHSDNKMIHRDVKASNILLNEEGIAKLGDFGVSEPLDGSARKLSITGTLLWVPPEVLNHDPNYNTAIDIWSLGITIIEMGDGDPPLSSLEEKVAMKEISSLDKPAPTFRDPSKWPPSLISFLGLCLRKDASKRRTARELLSEEIIVKASSNDVIKQLVAEVCTSTVNQTESSLSRKYEALLRENFHLLSIYKERRRKVIKVDQIIDSHKAVDHEFEELFRGSRQRNARINELRQKLKICTDEIQAFELEKNQLKACYDEKLNRRFDILHQMDIIKQKNNDELQRRTKLMSLESKS